MKDSAKEILKAFEQRKKKRLEAMNYRIADFQKQRYAETRRPKETT